MKSQETYLELQLLELGKIRRLVSKVRPNMGSSAYDVLSKILEAVGYAEELCKAAGANRAAVQPCVEQTETGLTVTEDATSKKGEAGNEPESLLCANCGHPRHVVAAILEKCQHCGDDEIDLSLDVFHP